MSVAHETFSDELWASKPIGWRLLLSDRLLWIALALSLLAHILLFAMHYSLQRPEPEHTSVNVSFRAANQSIARPHPAAPPSTAHILTHKATVTTPAATTTPAAHPTRPQNSADTATTANNAPSAPGNEGRRVALNANVKDYRYSQYLSDWRNKVERIGAMNYPEEARGRFFGTLVLSVALRPDGNVDRITVVRSSGNKILDDAAKRIVTMAAPFAPFPPDIRKETDYLDITRTWTFTRGDALETR